MISREALALLRPQLTAAMAVGLAALGGAAQAAEPGKGAAPAWELRGSRHLHSFTLLMHDPEPSINKTTEDVTHWMLFNIPGTATGLPGGVPAGNLPDGTIQIKGRGGANAYMGPGNPAINPYHHYTFELFALDTKLALDANATREQVMQAMNGHILGKAVLVGRFKRPQ